MTKRSRQDKLHTMGIIAEYLATMMNLGVASAGMTAEEAEALLIRQGLIERPSATELNVAQDVGNILVVRRDPDGQLMVGPEPEGEDLTILAQEALAEMAGPVLYVKFKIRTISEIRALFKKLDQGGSVTPLTLLMEILEIQTSPFDGVPEPMPKLPEGMDEPKRMVVLVHDYCDPTQEEPYTAVALQWDDGELVVIDGWGAVTDLSPQDDITPEDEEFIRQEMQAMASEEALMALPPLRPKDPSKLN